MGRAIEGSGGAVEAAIALARVQALLRPEPAPVATVEPEKPEQRFEVRDGATFIKARFGWRKR